MQIRTKIFLFFRANHASAYILFASCLYPAYALPISSHALPVSSLRSIHATVHFFCTFCPYLCPYPVRVLSMLLSTSFPRPARTFARIQSAFCQEPPCQQRHTNILQMRFRKKPRHEKKATNSPFFLVAAVGFEPTTYRV